MYNNGEGFETLIKQILKGGCLLFSVRTRSAYHPRHGIKDPSQPPPFLMTLKLLI